MLNKEVAGSGLPVVLLHGFCEDLSLWENLVKPLAQQNKVITIDLPGFGKSDPIEDDLSIENVASLVHNTVVNELHINEYIVIGHSLGGYICLALADLYSESIIAFGLVNSTSFADTEEKKLVRIKAIDFINKHGVAKFLEGFVGNLFTPQNQKLLSEEMAKVLNMGIALPNATVTGYMEAMLNRPDRSFILSQQNNVLFVGGTEDQHVPLPDNEKQLKLLHHPENGHIYDNVAHMGMYEAKNTFENAILNFLLSVKRIENG